MVCCSSFGFAEMFFAVTNTTEITEHNYTKRNIYMETGKQYCA